MNRFRCLWLLNICLIFSVYGEEEDSSWIKNVGYYWNQFVAESDSAPQQIRDEEVKKDLEVKEEKEVAVIQLASAVKDPTANDVKEQMIEGLRKKIQEKEERISQLAVELVEVNKKLENATVSEKNQKKREGRKECLKNEPQKNDAVADLLNCINIATPIDKRVEWIHPREECFVFHSFDNLSVWGEPYGFSAHYQSEIVKKQKLDFTLNTVGVGAGASYEFSDEVYCSGTAGYFHASLHRSTANGLFFGPAVAYHFTQGSAAGSVIAVRNFRGERNSWDLDLRGEGRFDVDLPEEFILHPFARLDYVKAWAHTASGSFLYSKLGMGTERTIVCCDEGYLTANVDLSWINMLPLGAGLVKCGKNESISLKTQTKNQLGVGVELVGMHMWGLCGAVQYEAAVGSDVTMQTGRVRLEWCW